MTLLDILKEERAITMQHLENVDRYIAEEERRVSDSIAAPSRADEEEPIGMAV